MKQIYQWRRCFPKSPHLFHVTCANITPANEGKIHTHDFAEVFWVVQGRGAHLINGREQPLKVGELCLIRPYRDLHKQQGHSPDFILYNVAFPKQVLDELGRRYFSARDFWGGDDPDPIMYYLTEPELQWLNAAARALAPAPQDRLLLDRFLLNLFCTLGHGQPDPWRACPPWLRMACEAIRQPEHFTRGTHAFTDLTHRTRGYVSRILKKYTGQTPHDVVNAARIQYAAGQLLTSTRGIQEVALDCGISSLSYFYRIFQKTFGKSPRQYRLDNFKVPVQTRAEESRRACHIYSRLAP